jgi:hypothetical protein
MFNLKEKLLAQGLVTKEQVHKIDAEKKPANTPREFESLDRDKAVVQLLAASKSEQYSIIRKWVDINRLDKPHLVNLDAEKFFINTKDQQVTWLTLPKEIINLITKGQAGVISYMSHHGLTHAVVAREIAEDVAKAYPDWLKVLNNLE